LKGFAKAAAALGCSLLVCSAFAQTGSVNTVNPGPIGPAANSVPATTAPLGQSPSVGQNPASTMTGGFSAASATPSAAPSLTGEAPVASAADGPVPTTLSADYKIGPNDLLEVEVFGVEELKRTVRVNSTGHISLPLIGTIPVAGMTSSDAQALIANEYAKDYIQNPQVSIFIKEFTSQRITVDGAVVRPGIYPLVGQITLLRALAMAGGGAQLSDLEQVVLFRITPDGKSETQRYDVNKIRTGEAPDPMLQGDDIVVVNRNSARVNLRDSLFSDIINTLNPFSATYRNTTGGQ
jgi:polysaccharide export outer membrane protein